MLTLLRLESLDHAGTLLRLDPFPFLIASEQLPLRKRDAAHLD